MRISDVLKYEALNVDMLDKELLLAHVLQKNREYIAAHADEEIPFTSFFLYRWYVHKRKKGVPLAYILGYKEFFGYTFFVNKHTLIPRPDTEILVEKAIEIIKHELEEIQKQYVLNAHLRVIDVGTGSGCIPVSILKTIGTKNGTISYTASDVSFGALKTAYKNAYALEANDVAFRTGGLLEPYDFSEYKNDTIIITANLPYLTHEQFIGEKSIQHEPYYALVAAENGLALYKQLLEQLTKKTETRKVILLCEIDPGQTTEFKHLVQHYFQDAYIEIIKDLAGHDRVVVVCPT